MHLEISPGQELSGSYTLWYNKYMSYSYQQYANYVNKKYNISWRQWLPKDTNIMLNYKIILLYKSVWYNDITCSWDRIYQPYVILQYTVWKALI